MNHRMTMAGALLAAGLAALAGCGQADKDRNEGVGPAEQAGKTLDEAGAKVATNVAAKVREEVDRADAAAREARANAPDAVDKARRGLGDAAREVGEKMEAAGRRMRRLAAAQSAANRAGAQTDARADAQADAQAGRKEAPER